MRLIDRPLSLTRALRRAFPLPQGERVGRAPWRLTGITHHRIFFGFVFRTVQEERLCGTFDGAKLFERRERLMRAGDLRPASDWRMEREIDQAVANVKRAFPDVESEPGDLVRQAAE